MHVPAWILGIEYHGDAEVNIVERKRDLRVLVRKGMGERTKGEEGRGEGAVTVYMILRALCVGARFISSNGKRTDQLMRCLALFNYHWVPPLR
jgi:hypothetical protein